MEESQFQTIASETVNGLTGSLMDNSTNHENAHTIFIIEKPIPSNKLYGPCLVCEGQHNIQNCQNFIENKVSDSLSEGRPGKLCQRSHQCGQNGCPELQHRLLKRQHP